MDLPLLVSPASLGQLSARLADASRQVGQVAARAEQLAGGNGWTGGAGHAFATAARTAEAQCVVLSRRLAIDAARVEQLERELVHELVVLQHLEDEVLGALHRLAVRATGDVTGAAEATYDRVRRRIPGHLSPLWHDLASSLVGGELL